ncbi:unnamed protein product [Closterium sp. Naga37s-1]|nr:unnamed protein product [Closterium sp. Naga37s-1]
MAAVASSSACVATKVVASSRLQTLSSFNTTVSTYGLVPSTTRSLKAAGRRAVQPVAALKWVLEPIGDGDTAHLEQEIAKPGPIDVAGDAVVIGRMAERADVVIPVPTVSGVHARLENRGDVLVITDLDSTNGTFVDNAPLKPGNTASLAVGSVVIFGDQHLAQFKVTQVDVPEPEAAA